VCVFGGGAKAALKRYPVLPAQVHAAAVTAAAEAAALYSAFSVAVAATCICNSVSVSSTSRSYNGSQCLALLHHNLCAALSAVTQMLMMPCTPPSRSVLGPQGLWSNRWDLYPGSRMAGGEQSQHVGIGLTSGYIILDVQDDLSSLRRFRDWP
jgi:hypothetical protein